MVRAPVLCKGRCHRHDRKPAHQIRQHDELRPLAHQLLRQFVHGQIKVLLAHNLITQQKAVDGIVDAHDWVFDMALDDVGVYIFGVVQIPLRVRARCVPAEYGACQHGGLLNVCNVAPRIVAAGDLAVFFAFPGVPLGGIIAALTAPDDNKLPLDGRMEKQVSGRSFLRIGSFLIAPAPVAACGANLPAA